MTLDPYAHDHADLAWLEAIHGYYCEHCPGHIVRCSRCLRPASEVTDDDFRCDFHTLRAAEPLPEICHEAYYGIPCQCSRKHQKEGSR